MLNHGAIKDTNSFYYSSIEVLIDFINSINLLTQSSILSLFISNSIFYLSLEYYGCLVVAYSTQFQPLLV